MIRDVFLEEKRLNCLFSSRYIFNLPWGNRIAGPEPIKAESKQSQNNVLCLVNGKKHHNFSNKDQSESQKQAVNIIKLPA